MPRHERLNTPGCIYHVITQAIERRKIFRDNQDREEFLSRLEKALEETGCECPAWVLMDNRLHLLTRTGEKPLSDLMRKVLTGYANYFNRRLKRHGYLYQNRYKSILCQEDEYYLEQVRYIHLNPVRAGIVKTPKQLDTYPWTGHAVIVGKKQKKWQHKIFSIEADQILRKGRANDVLRAKNLISLWASRELGISGKEIADYFGVSSPAISYSIKQGEKYVRQNDVNLLF